MLLGLLNAYDREEVSIRGVSFFLGFSRFFTIAAAHQSGDLSAVVAAA
jgi:hypothetical protein